MDLEGFCPYVGLQPFTEQEREFFFGRKADSRLIAANLAAARVTVFYGPSGVGKSSVLMAGALPILKERSSTAAVVFREWARPDAIRLLKRSILAAAHGAEPADGADDPALDELIGSACAKSGKRIVVMLDQFEEYFVYYPPGRSDNIDAELARAINRTDLDCNFMLSLREDSLSALDRFRPRIVNLLENRLRLAHLDRNAAEEAIRGPLTRWNEKAGVAEADGYSAEDPLVEAVLEQVQSGRVRLARTSDPAAKNDEPRVGPPGEGGIETPFLQLVMTKLWEKERELHSRRLRLTTLETLGNAANIVRSHLDGVMAPESNDIKEVCARLFDRLVTPSGTKIALKLDDLVSYAGDLGNRVQEAVAMLVEHRLLRAIQPPPGEQVKYEIFHDVLAPAAIDWQRRYFLEKARLALEREAAERDAVHVRELKAANDLAEARARSAEEAEAREKLEALRAKDALASAKMQKVLAITGLVAVVVLAIITAMAWNAGHVADAGRLAADAQRELRDNPDEALTHAIQAVRVAVTRDSTRALLDASARVAMSDRATGPQTLSIAGAGGVQKAAQALAMAVASADETVAVAGSDGAVTLFFLRDGRQRSVLSASAGPVTSVAFDHDGTVLMSGGFDGFINLWNVLTGSRIGFLDNRLPVSGLAISRNVLAVASLSGRVNVWRRVTDATTNRDDWTLDRTQLDGRAVAFSPDGAWLATGDGDGNVRVWRTDALGSSPKIDASHRGAPITALAFSHDSTRLASASFDGTVLLRPAAGGGQATTLRPNSGPVTSVAFSPDGKYVACGTSESVVVTWKLGNAAPDRPSRDHKQPVTSVVYSESGILASASLDGTVIVRRTNVSMTAGDDGRLNESISRFAVSSGSSVIATIDRTGRGTIGLWDVATGRRTGQLPPADPGSYRTGIALSPDGNLLAVGSTGEHKWFVWDIEQKDIAEFNTDGTNATSVAFTQDGAWLAVGHDNGSIALWDVDGRRALRTLQGDFGSVASIAFSTDKKVMATMAVTRAPSLQAVVWDVGSSNGKLLDTGGTGEVTSMALNPQGTRVAMGTANDRRATLLLWDIGQQPPKAIHMETYKNIVTNVAFSPDGNTLAVGTGHAAADQPGGQRVLQRAPVNPAPASSGAAGEVHLWDVQAWRRISGAFASGHEYPIEAVAFSRDGKTLLVGVPHPMPIFWPLEHSAWDAVGCALKRGEEPCGTKPTPRKNDGLNASSEPARVQGPQ